MRPPALAVLAALSLGLLAPHLASARAADAAPASADGARITVEAHGLRPPAPLFFTASVDQSLEVAPEAVTGKAALSLRVVQGRAETLTLGLVGEGDVVQVSGPGLRDWAVRQGLGPDAGRRFLDLRPAPPPAKNAKADKPDETPRTLELEVRFRLERPSVPGRVALPLLVAGDSVGFASRVVVHAAPALDLAFSDFAGLVPAVAETAAHPGSREFVVRADAGATPRLVVALARRGAAPDEASLASARLLGAYASEAGGVAFRLEAQASSPREGARLRLLSGRAAPDGSAAGDGWRLEFVPPRAPSDEAAYDLVFTRKGPVPVSLSFAAAVREIGGWQRLDFTFPAGSAVPLVLSGLPAGTEFDASAPVVPASAEKDWRGFLPADGRASLGWRHARESGGGALAFTSTELADLRVGSGLLRQSSVLAFRILQGRMNSVRLRLSGPGEIVAVEADNLLSWSVLPLGANDAPDARVLELRFNRPLGDQASVTVRSQTALGAFPVRVEPLRLVPEGGVRHSGHLRVANRGAVRLEVVDLSGLLQLAPAQFPGAAPEGEARQVFVYRFPSAERACAILASQIMPEVSASALLLHELGEANRVVSAEVELDIREAPLRDWSLLVPADHAILAVEGAEVADHVAESTPDARGLRRLKVVFKDAVSGRQLLRLRLEKNQPPAAGEWTLPRLEFPEAKTLRGHVGVIAAAGFRLAPLRSEALVEVPLAYFPRQARGLQQAFRLRSPDWSATLRVEALGQNIQADVFHLHSLKEGVVHASVLLNYFVVGAPAGEWRLSLPPSAGNIDVVGQNVRRDWRREGDELIVTLHQPVLGAATLLVTFEEPMSARGGLLHPGRLRPLDVQSERGYVQVVSPLQVKHELRSAEGGLLRLEPAELPAEYRLLSSSPSLAVYQYTARPFALELGVEWYAPGDPVEQVVDFARFTSRVSAHGQVLTDARLFIKTRGRKALRLELPPEARLWEASADGQSVNARLDAGQTVIPLPPRLNPNEAVEVLLRLGQPAASSPSRIRLVAPRLFAPTVVGEWTIGADEGRRLLPRGADAALVRPVRAPGGFEWISARAAGPALLLLSLVAAGLLALRARQTRWSPVALLASLAALIVAAALANESLRQGPRGSGDPVYAFTLEPAGEAVALELANVPAWRAAVSLPGAFALAASLAVAAAGLAGRPPALRRFWPPLAALLLAFGLLVQPGGAAYFFAALALLALIVLPLSVLRAWRAWRTRHDRDGNRDDSAPPPAPDPLAGSVASLLLLLALAAFSFGSVPRAQAAEAAPLPAPASAPAFTPAESLVQRWELRGGRLFAEIDLTVRGRPGESFLLLEAPAVLTAFTGDGLRVAKIARDDGFVYLVVPEREGVLGARATYELPVPDPAKGVALPTGPAAVQRLEVRLDQPGWDIASPAAVRVSPLADLGAGQSGADLVLGPGAGPRRLVTLSPRRRDPAAEPVRFFAESANLFVPGPGVVNGHARFSLRPVQGLVSSLELEIPEGFSVGEVGRGPVGAWRFDPATRRLRVAIEPAQSQPFHFLVETQKAGGALPFDLSLRPLRVLGAAGEVGLLALGFGDDAQPEALRAEKVFSPVNVQDFDESLLPRDREKRPLALLRHVYRHGSEQGEVSLRVAPVEPELRVAAKQVLSLGDDRLLLAADLAVSITRVGVFKLSFILPEGLEVEGLTGASLAHWTEAEENGVRVVTLHLAGRTLGEQSFALTLAGPAPAANSDWTVPRLALREATRQTGELQIVPAKGLRLRALQRAHVSQLDPRDLGNTKEGALAFRLLQADWRLGVGIEALQPWVTVQALQELTVREGQTLTRLALRYRVENAAVRAVRLRLPGLDDEQKATLRAGGPAVGDLVPVPDEADAWELRFQRGILGETEAWLEHRGLAARAQGREQIATPVFADVRQSTQFVAVRAGGRLEFEPPEPPRGWQRADWGSVPAFLQDRADRSVPALCFRVAEPERPLALAVRRHEVADIVKLRVTGGELVTLLSPSGEALTAADLRVEVLEKSTLRVSLPKQARLFAALVNGENVAAVREGDACLFHVAPASADSRAAAVRLVYSTPAAPGRRLELRGPGLNTPLENIGWRVVLPPGHELADHDGDLRLVSDHPADGFGLESYLVAESSRRATETRRAAQLLEQANALLQSGSQQQAGEVLSRATKVLSHDQAANEDARVQLRALKTQQAVVGLNTRRQRLYLSNSGEVAPNAQLEQAASLNPLMRGSLSFDPKQLDQLLMGNTQEETSALRGIAARIVDQQLAAEPAPAAIDIAPPPRGRVLTFGGGLRIDGDAPLALELRLRPARHTSLAFAALLLLATAALAGLLRPSPSRFRA